MYYKELFDVTLGKINLHVVPPSFQFVAEVLQLRYLVEQGGPDQLPFQQLTAKCHVYLD